MDPVLLAIKLKFLMFWQKRQIKMGWLKWKDELPRDGAKDIGVGLIANRNSLREMYYAPAEARKENLKAVKKQTTEKNRQLAEGMRNLLKKYKEEA